jgi:hypothetical protein
MTRPSAVFVSRAAALGLPLVLLLLAWSLVVQPVIGWWSDEQETRAELADQVSRLSRVAGRRGGIETALRQMHATLADPALFWIAASEPAVSALIQQRLREAVTAGGGSLRSTTDLPATPEHGLHRVTLRLQAAGTVPALQAMLQAVETTTPALFIDGITINAADSAGAGHPPELSVELDVTGFARVSQ